MNISVDKIWEIIHKGSMPALYEENGNPELYYSMYVSTYIERDVRNLTQVGDTLSFLKFMTALASRIGQLLNLNSVANEVGITITTAQRWLSILVTSNIVYILEPYYNNIMKRAVKTPKVYFLDTGLAAYLTRWSNKDVLQNGNMAGNFFENFVIVEILKSYYNHGELQPPLYFYRDKEKREIDQREKAPALFREVTPEQSGGEDEGVAEQNRQRGDTKPVLPETKAADKKQKHQGEIAAARKEGQLMTLRKADPTWNKRESDKQSRKDDQRKTETAMQHQITDQADQQRQGQRPALHYLEEAAPGPKLGPQGAR